MFKQHELREAYAYAEAGEIAVHVHFMVFANSPACFKRDMNRGYPIAHVLGQDKEHLIAIAHDCGVKKVVVECQGTRRQHIDLCGKPLIHCLTQMDVDIEDYTLEKQGK